MQLQNGLHHLAVLVRDLAEAETFYAGILGLPVARRWPDGDGGTRSIWLDAGGFLLMLERATPGASRREAGGGGWHLPAFAIALEDREPIRAHLTTHGVPIQAETSYSLYVEDPEGNQIGFSHWPERQPET